MKTVVVSILDLDRPFEDIESIVQAIEREFGDISDDNHELAYSATELFFDSKDDEFKQSLQSFCSQFQGIAVAWHGS